MPNTPSVDPPIVVRSDGRLLMHEACFAAVLVGLKRVFPQFFIYGSFNVDPSCQHDPIHVPNPMGGADVVFNYRVELGDFAVDLPPADITVGMFPDPFNLSPNTIALYSAATIDLAGDPVTNWQVRISTQLWLECAVSFSPDGWLLLQLTDASVMIDQLANTFLITALNHVVHDYLRTVVPTLRLPVSVLVNSDWLSIEATGLQLQLDAADLSFTISVH